jgi:hypothetical protein
MPVNGSSSLNGSNADQMVADNNMGTTHVVWHHIDK